jgi:hypothetical protein
MPDALHHAEWQRAVAVISFKQGVPQRGKRMCHGCDRVFPFKDRGPLCRIHRGLRHTRGAKAGGNVALFGNADFGVEQRGDK